MTKHMDYYRIYMDDSKLCDGLTCFKEGSSERKTIAKHQQWKIHFIYIKLKKFI